MNENHQHEIITTQFDVAMKTSYHFYEIENVASLLNHQPLKM